jgi:hypothetical protein
VTARLKVAIIGPSTGCVGPEVLTMVSRPTANSFAGFRPANG